MGGQWVPIHMLSVRTGAFLVRSISNRRNGNGWFGQTALAVRFLTERKYIKKKDVDTKTLPFLVKRTPSGNLPVYTHCTERGKKVTRVRHVFGDAEHLAAEIEKICDSRPARIGKGGRKAVEVMGSHT